MGDFELHPGAAAEFGYDSNFLRRADEEDPVGSLRLRITPSFSLSTLSPQRRQTTANTPPPSVHFRLGLSASYHEFFPVSGSESGRARLRDQRNVTGLFDLRLDILPGRPWSGIIYGSLGRDITPPSNLAQEGESFRRISPTVGTELIWTPGSGLFDWRIGYQLDGTIFEDTANFGSLTNLLHTFRTRGRWRFLPRTALLFEGKWGYLHYLSAGKQAHPLRATLGVNGLITSWLSLLATAGWGASYYDPFGTPDPSTPEFDSLISQVEFKFFLTPNPAANPQAATMVVSTLSAGFLRDFYDSYISTYLERNRGYLKFSYFTGGRFLLTVDGGVGGIGYSDATAHPDPWTDIRADATAFAEYRFKDWLGVNATVRYGTNISDVALDENDRLQWQQFEAYLGVRWLM